MSKTPSTGRSRNWTFLACFGGALAAVLGAACSNGESGGRDAGSVAADAPTWHEHIAPLVTEKCGSCHQSGGIAPFSIESYEQAKAWAGPIAAAVEAGRMPPFLAQETAACKPRLPYRNDTRLSAAEKALVRAWVDADAPEGDPEKAQELALPTVARVEREDVIMRVPEITVEGTDDIHTCVVVDPGIDHDTFILARQLTSGNDKVLHHVVSYVIPAGVKEDGSPRSKAELEQMILDLKGIGIGGRYDCFGGPNLTGLQTEMLDAWAPGAAINRAPPESAQPIKKDSLVVMDVHYHPTGGPAETDRDTKLSLMLTDEKPTYISRVILLGNFQQTLDVSAGTGELLLQPGESEPEFMIPANQKNHVEEMTWIWKLPIGPIKAYSASAHMHFVGREMRVTLQHSAESDEECLVETPAWDYNWQRSYAFDADYEDLPVMAAGDMLRFRCVFDNTMGNRFVVKALEQQELDAPIDVRLGENTLDEMCLSAIGIIYPYFETPPTPPVSADAAAPDAGAADAGS